MDKKIILLTAACGSAIGGYMPVILGASSFGGWSILGALVGGLAGIWIGARLQD